VCGRLCTSWAAQLDYETDDEHHKDAAEEEDRSGPGASAQRFEVGDRHADPSDHEHASRDRGDQGIPDPLAGPVAPEVPAKYASSAAVSQ